MIADAQVDRPVSSRSPSPNDMDNDNCLNSLGVPPLACQGKEGILHFALLRGQQLWPFPNQLWRSSGKRLENSV